MRTRICTDQINLPTALFPFRHADVSGLRLKGILVFHFIFKALGDKVLAKFKRPVKEMNIREPAKAKQCGERCVEFPLRHRANVISYRLCDPRALSAFSL